MKNYEPNCACYGLDGPIIQKANKRPGPCPSCGQMWRVYKPGIRLHKALKSKRKNKSMRKV